MAQHFRKYGFHNPTDWATAKAQITKTDEEGNEYYDNTIASVVYEIGNLCEQWGTDAEGNPVCEITSPLYSVDVVWADAPLSSWDSAIVWPVPVGVSSMGYSLDKEYAEAYCIANPDAAYCNPPAPIEP